jgi:hypothetical protein
MTPAVASSAALMTVKLMRTFVTSNTTLSMVLPT